MSVEPHVQLTTVLSEGFCDSASLSWPTRSSTQSEPFMKNLSYPLNNSAPRTGDHISSLSASVPIQEEISHTAQTTLHSVSRSRATYAKTALTDFDTLPDCANVRLPVVRKLYGGISSASVWRNSGKTIPSPRKLTPRVTAWNVGELRIALGMKRNCHE